MNTIDGNTHAVIDWEAKTSFRKRLRLIILPQTRDL